MVTLLLTEQLTVLFLMMGCGFVLVKSKIVKSRDSKTLSLISVYLIMPCVIINAFQIDYSKEIQDWIFTGYFFRCYHSSSIVSYLRNPWKIFKFNFRRKSIFDLFQCRKSDYSACYFRSRKRMGHLFKRIYVCPDLAFVDTCTVHYAGKNRI